MAECITVANWDDLQSSGSSTAYDETPWNEPQEVEGFCFQCDERRTIITYPYWLGDCPPSNRCKFCESNEVTLLDKLSRYLLQRLGK